MAQVSPTPLEQTVLETLRKLPTERQKQVLDSVRFLEKQDDSTSEENGDTKWERLFVSKNPNSLLKTC
jgi:mRNA-degrading endonuclease RelE of RelBE toxin-antitoxin system